LSAESRINKPGTKKNPSSPEGGSASKCPGEILRKLHPFKRWDKRNGTFQEMHIPGGAKVIGCRLLAFTAIGSDN
jgi:hypothetical protein